LPPINDLGRPPVSAEEIHEPLNQRVLSAAVEAPYDAHSREILNALEPRAAIALQLLKDGPGVLHPGSRRYPEIVANYCDGVTENLRVVHE
jgi:hypothetical protein